MYQKLDQKPFQLNSQLAITRTIPTRNSLVNSDSINSFTSKLEHYSYFQTETK